MPFAGSTFTRVANTFSNPVTGAVIDPTAGDALFDDYDTALTYLYSLTSLDSLLGSTPNLFAVRGASVWGQSAITGAHLPNPSTTTLGGMFSLPVSSNSVLSGLGNDGTPTRATTTGTGDVVRATSPTIVTSLLVSGFETITSSSSAAFAVGRQGLTDPAFTVDASAASSATGLAIMAQSAAAAVLNVNVTSSGSNASLAVDAKGTGTINFGITSTGGISLWRVTNFHGSTSGATSVQATAVASGTLTLPAATDTLVGKATTDTLTNKTYDTGGTGNSFSLNGAAFGTQAQALAALQNPLLIAGVAVDFNSVGDNAITIVLPTGVTRYRIQGIITINNGTTASLTTAQFGVFTAAAGGGTAIVASGTALSTITSNAAETNTSLLVSGSAVTAWFTDTSLFYRVTQAQGAAASGFAYIQYQPLPG